MGLDIRTPLGVLFSVIGLLLDGFHWLSDPAIYRRSLGIEINLWWGLVLLVFGALMLWLSRRSVHRTP